MPSKLGKQDVHGPVAMTDFPRVQRGDALPHLPSASSRENSFNAGFDSSFPGGPPSGHQPQAALSTATKL